MTEASSKILEIFFSVLKIRSYFINRHVRESHPNKNWDEPENAEAGLLTDFWFHFIHYLEPCFSLFKDNAENIPPGRYLLISYREHKSHETDLRSSQKMPNNGMTSQNSIALIVHFKD